jgi:hypothetical protein
MKVRNINANATEVETSKATILFSYGVPVAACMADGSGFIRTATRYSVTTSKHINGWLAGAKAREVPQEELNRLV